MTTSSRIIFSGNEKRIKRFTKRTWYWLIGLLCITVPLLLFLPPIDFSLRSLLEPLIAIGIAVACLSSLALLPQNFEIREDGIAPPVRGYINGLMRRKRFIKYSEINDINIGENALHHEIVLKNGKTISIGLGGAFFLSLSVSDNRIGRMEKILRKVREELIKHRNHDGEVIIRKEDIGID